VLIHNPNYPKSRFTIDTDSPYHRMEWG